MFNLKIAIFFVPLEQSLWNLKELFKNVWFLKYFKDANMTCSVVNMKIFIINEWHFTIGGP